MSTIGQLKVAARVWSHLVSLDGMHLCRIFVRVLFPYWITYAGKNEAGATASRHFEITTSGQSFVFDRPLSQLASVKKDLVLP